MNILFFKSNGIIASRGGISRITENLTTLFRRHGDIVWLLGIQNLHKDENVQYDESQLFLPNGDRLSDKANVVFLTSLIKKEGIDAIINQNEAKKEYVLFLYECHKLTGVKVFFCFHNSILTPAFYYAYTRQFPLLEQGRNWLFRFLKTKIVRDIGVEASVLKYRKIYKTIIEKSQSVVLLCDGQVSELERASGIHPIRNAHVIYNSLKCLPSRDTIKSKSIVWVGSFDYNVKRPDSMLRIWEIVERNCPDWTLYMLGDGPSFDRCKKMAEELGLKKVVFTGRTMPDSYYQKAQILCSTSVHECFPMVLLEAMSNALAIIAFDSFSSSNLLVTECGNGALVPSFDIHSYAQKLIEIIQNDSLRERMQHNATVAVKRFDEEAIYKMWCQLIDNQA